MNNQAITETMIRVFCSNDSWTIVGMAEAETAESLATVRQALVGWKNRCLELFLNESN